VRRHGRFGAYVSCSNYPKCKYKPPKPVQDTGVKCPKDGGAIVERRGRFRPFYGCVNYPACDFSLNARPIPRACPQCGNPYLLLRERKAGAILACDRAGCGFEAPSDDIPPMREVLLETTAAPRAKRKTAAASATADRKAPSSRKRAVRARPAAEKATASARRRVKAR
jgi:DNA topoisomerase-1